MCTGALCAVIREQLARRGKERSSSDVDMVPREAPFVWRSSTIPALRGLPHVMTLNWKHSYRLLLMTSPPPHKRTTHSYALPRTYIGRSGRLQFTPASLYLRFMRLCEQIFVLERSVSAMCLESVMHPPLLKQDCVVI